MNELNTLMLYRHIGTCRYRHR